MAALLRACLVTLLLRRSLAQASTCSGSAASDVFQSCPGQSCAGAPGDLAPYLYFEVPSLPRTLKARTEHLTYTEQEYAFGLVADLDLLSRDPQEFIWRSYLRKGRVVRVDGREDRFALTWDEELELRTTTATRNRSMELSEMVLYNRLLIAFCDCSGIAYKIDPLTGKTFQRWAIADGDGNEPKPFKGEWATVKGDAIWLGSIGFEWYGPQGEVQHRNAEWVKIIDVNGLIRNLNWHPIYQAIRTATNTTMPGYLWHEAVEWEPQQKLWVMLPRFASTEHRYKPGSEHFDSADMLIVADESFSNIKVTRLQHHDPLFGFTSVKRLPGSHHLFMVLRVYERGSEHRTQAAVIGLDGSFFSDPPYIEVGARKFEGLAFF